MNPYTVDIAHILLALTMLGVAAHVAGALFSRARQPRVIGEIVGGLLLGPTVLGTLAPDVTSWLFPQAGSTPAVIGAVQQLGLFFLLFCAGTEVRLSFERRESRAVWLITLAGTLVPFALGTAVVRWGTFTQFWGPAATSAAFTLVFGVAIAVTSIPVIARIMHDLRILQTRFARLVLNVAVVEDLLLYVVLAIALGLTVGSKVPEFMGLPLASSLGIAGYVAATAAAVLMTVGPVRYLYARLVHSRLVSPESDAVAYQLFFMFLTTSAFVALGLQGFLGAFLSGIVVRAARPRDRGLETIRDFTFAFLIPIYFAFVGLQLDLLHGFNPLLFLLFLVGACVSKGGAVYLGARLAQESGASSLNLAVALNARGGPGIVLASVALGAGVINQTFYAMLVMLAVVTSLLAGAWLERVSRAALLDETGAADVEYLSSRSLG